VRLSREKLDTVTFAGFVSELKKFLNLVFFSFRNYVRSKLDNLTWQDPLTFE